MFFFLRVKLTEIEIRKSKVLVSLIPQVFCHCCGGSFPKITEPKLLPCIHGSPLLFILCVFVCVHNALQHTCRSERTTHGCQCSLSTMWSWDQTQVIMLSSKCLHPLYWTFCGFRQLCNDMYPTLYSIIQVSCSKTIALKFLYSACSHPLSFWHFPCIHNFIFSRMTCSWNGADLGFSYWLLLLMPYYTNCFQASHTDHLQELIRGAGARVPS